MEHTDESCGLKVVGQGELANQIRDDLAKKELTERVELLGPLWGDKLMKLMEDSAAIVIPSEWYDNLPLILCQANAIGKPVIASRIDGIPEYIREGQNGFLFEAGNVFELAKLVENVLSLSPREYTTLSDQTRSFALSELDYPNHYQNLMATIERLTA